MNYFSLLIFGVPVFYILFANILRYLFVLPLPMPIWLFLFRGTAITTYAGIFLGLIIIFSFYKEKE
ncbi:hypothetical protein [Chengkuizengella axinellae]|uniref:Uncharacterized protein n=1 Tax=Chengkuizengella axinellae TaxID=3064388 RepID=A0ABT9IUP1_9BACL|nr:hypothetical protein [Chengkuizengella sp. 2205SS18-9]MDP5273048.1 hypothetical protein [Chengkuizengella sp. 2205SS18-9]